MGGKVRNAAVLVCVLAGCGNGGQGRPPAGNVGAVLQGRFGVTRSHKTPRDLPAPDAVSLLNVTGSADSLLLLTPEDGCGFSAWSANNQQGPVGVEGRTGEAFDIAHPADWTSKGTGLREGCAGGALQAAEAYFYYLDFHLDLDHDGTRDRVVRVYTSESGGAKFGDLQVQDGDGVFKWVDTAGGDALVAARPATLATYSISNNSGPLQVPWMDGNGARKMVMTKLPLQLSQASTGRSVSPDTRKVVFNVDFSAAGLTATDKNSPAGVAKTLSIPFLTNVQAQLTTLRAEVTPLLAAQVDGPEDPAPGLGGGGIATHDGGTPDGGN